MYKHLLIKTLSKDWNHSCIVSYTVGRNELFLKVQRGKLTQIELIHLMAEICKDQEVLKEIKNWNPVHTERGTFVYTGFSGCTDHYILYRDGQTGFISRKKVVHTTMSGYIETKNDGNLSFFLPDFFLLGINNEFYISSKFFIDILKGTVSEDNYSYDLWSDPDQKKWELTVKFQELSNQDDNYCLEEVGSLQNYIERIEQQDGFLEPYHPEEEKAEEIIGE